MNSYIIGPSEPNALDKFREDVNTNTSKAVPALQSHKKFNTTRKLGLKSTGVKLGNYQPYLETTPVQSNLFKKLTPKYGSQFFKSTQASPKGLDMSLQYFQEKNLIKGEYTLKNREVLSKRNSYEYKPINRYMKRRSDAFGEEDLQEFLEKQKLEVKLREQNLKITQQ